MFDARGCEPLIRTELAVEAVELHELMGWEFGEGDGPFEMHTHSGDVRVSVPKTPLVIVDVRTHGGRVDNGDAGAPPPGAARTVLTVWTFSGDVHVQRK